MRFYKLLVSRRAITRMQSIIIAAIIIVAGVGAALYYVTRPPPAVKPIKIGITYTDPYVLSKGAKIAAELAAEEINDAGGILGRPIKLMIEETRGELPIAVAAYRKLVMTDRVMAVIVTDTSEVVMALQETAAELYPEYKHLLLAADVPVDDVVDKVTDDYDKYKFFFRFYRSNIKMFEQFLIPSLEYLIKELGFKKIHVLLEDAEWTVVFQKGQPASVAAMIEEMGGECVGEVLASVDEKIFLPIFETVATSGADCIYFMSARLDDVTCTKQWAKSAAKDIDIFWGTTHRLGFWEATEGAALGVTGFCQEALVRCTEKSVQFIESMMARNAPLEFGWGAYESLYFLKTAAEELGSIDDIEALIGIMEETEIVGVRGKVKFVEGHNLYQNWTEGYYYYWMCQWQKDGELVVYYPPVLRDKTNPGKDFMKITELRASAG